MKSRLKELLDFCTQNGRVCPHPLHWEKLWKIILKRKRDGVGRVPPRPLILAAWWETSIREKRMRLQEHIRWAHDYEAFDKVDAYIRRLPEEQWYHSEEL